MADRPPRIYVLAGTNGAGKSSIVGAMLREVGADYFNPDEAARRIRAADPRLTATEANSTAWHEGKRLLEHAIAGRLDFAFESTLGATTIPVLLAKAASLGIEVRVWYMGLSSPELHIARVRTRVAKGGHDIPAVDIRRRWETGRLNLIRLMPKLTELRIYDNSGEADPDTGAEPIPVLVVHVTRGRIVAPLDLRATPAWAKPLVAAQCGSARRRASSRTTRRSGAESPRRWRQLLAHMEHDEPLGVEPVVAARVEVQQHGLAVDLTDQHVPGIDTRCEKRMLKVLPTQA